MLITLVSSATLTGFIALSGWLLIPLALSYGLIATEQANAVYENAFTILTLTWFILNFVPFCLIIWRAYMSNTDKED